MGHLTHVCALPLLRWAKSVASSMGREAPELRGSAVAVEEPCNHVDDRQALAAGRGPGVPSGRDHSQDVPVARRRAAGWSL